jgi:hypothetical protein
LSWKKTKLIIQQKPGPYNKGGKNDIRDSLGSYHEGVTSNNIKNNITKENNSTKTTINNTNTTNNARFDDNLVAEKSSNSWRYSVQ